jgi:uncharacterized protein (UPF0333 family)
LLYDDTISPLLSKTIQVEKTLSLLFVFIGIVPAIIQISFFIAKLFKKSSALDAIEELFE